MILPFKHSKVVGQYNFINRTKDIEKLQINFLSKINTILISPRRWGKTSLVLKAGEELSKKNSKIKIAHVDLFGVRTEEHFYKTLSEQIIKVSSTKWETRVKESGKFLKKLAPKFTFGVDPINEFSMGFDWEEVKKDPSEILNLAENISKEKNIEIVICIDEFQNIAHFEDPIGFQKILRAHWQHHKTANYCLYGSKRHMMVELFENKSMPFYKFGDVFFMPKIDNSHWIKYIVKTFKKTKKTISPKTASLLAKSVENHPYFVQQLANVVWRNTQIECSKKILEESIEELVLQYDMMFQKEIDNLTNPQVNLLKAMVNEEQYLSSQAVIKKYNLISSSNVSRARKALVSKEVIDTFEKDIIFLDPLFKLWVKMVYMTLNK